MASLLFETARHCVGCCASAVCLTHCLVCGMGVCSIECVISMKTHNLHRCTANDAWSVPVANKKREEAFGKTLMKKWLA